MAADILVDSGAGSLDQEGVLDSVGSAADTSLGHTLNTEGR